MRHGSSHMGGLGMRHGSSHMGGLGMRLMQGLGMRPGATDQQSHTCRFL